jgi:LAO/AO transport system kinase
MKSIEELLRLWSEDRIRALSKCITLAESKLDSDRILVREFILRNNNLSSSIRIGISGPPGVGKSTFIDAFGLAAVNSGYRVAVLAVDPSSKETGGSILGDKTRMVRLSNHREAYVRPNPSGSALDGTISSLRESIRLCEMAGFNLILVETVGVGQIESNVGIYTDLTFALHLPSSGDSIQAIKKGLIETSDYVIVTKADGDLAIPAQMAKFEIEDASRLIQPDCSTVKVYCVSSISDESVRTFWNVIELRLKDESFLSTVRIARKQKLVLEVEVAVRTEIERLIRSSPEFERLKLEILRIEENSYIDLSKYTKQVMRYLCSMSFQ